MSKMVTRCPQCQTSFRVTDEHLKIANGAVRCGSCLNVFQAKDHWVPDTPPLATPAAATSTSAASGKPASRFSSPIPTPSFLQAADKLAATSQAAGKTIPAPTASQAPATSQAPSASQFQFRQTPTETKGKGKFQFDQSSIDSGSASSLLAEPDERIPETALTKAHSQADTNSDNTLPQDTDHKDEPISTGLPEFGTDDDDYSSLFDESDMANAESEDFESLLSDNFDDLDGLIENKPVKEEEADVSDETWAKDLLDELEDEVESTPVPIKDTEQDDGFPLDFSNPTDVDAARRDLGLDQPSSFDISKFAPISVQTVGLSAGSAAQVDTNAIPEASAAPAAIRARQPSSSREDLIAHIGPAPVEITPVENRATAAWKGALAEIAICSVLVLTLIGQHLFFQFDHLAKQESTRPLVAFVCNILGCKLPPSEVWRNIRVSNLVVRKHDSVANALVVDAIIFNHAAYELPFPKLELYFNDLEQLPVASRRFEPHEYLAGELEGKTLMPPGRPIHIAFEIVNPGDKAVNWQLDVTPFE